MATYPDLTGLAQGAPPWLAVTDELVDIWIRDYRLRTSRADIVLVHAGNFDYLFDIAGERLLAAYGISQGANSEARDRSRMAGHPHSAGVQYHRGHAIPHSLGGPTDINLVPQLGRVNIGPFRALERQAVANPGALYFTYWSYAAGDSQVPVSVDQGLLLPGGTIRISTHPN